MLHSVKPASKRLDEFPKEQKCIRTKFNFYSSKNLNNKHYKRFFARKFSRFSSLASILLKSSSEASFFTYIWSKKEFVKCVVLSVPELTTWTSIRKKFISCCDRITENEKIFASQGRNKLKANRLYTPLQNWDLGLLKNNFLTPPWVDLMWFDKSSFSLLT